MKYIYDEGDFTRVRIFLFKSQTRTVVETVTLGLQAGNQIRNPRNLVQRTKNRATKAIATGVYRGVGRAIAFPFYIQN